VAYAEKRGGLWRARWRSPDGTLESKPGFRTRKAAEDYGRDQEAAIRAGTYVDPRAGRITLTEWVNQWFPALDLEPTTLSNYRYMVEVHILPAFGDRPLASLTPEEISAWEMRIAACGYSPRTARDARTTLTTVLSDAIPRYIQVNPAQRKRGKGRKGQRRIARIEQAEKVWPTPLEALLVAERCAALSGRDTDFIMIITLAYTGMRWSEVIGLTPKAVRGDVLRINRKLYELKSRFYEGPPKDGSIRNVDMPPFLAELIARHLKDTPDRTCKCHNPEPPWCPGAEHIFLGPAGGHFSRSGYGERRFRPAANGWYPARGKQPARPVLIDAGALFPGTPLLPWPAAKPGEEFALPAGRGVTRLVSDPWTGRCLYCRRALPRRLDGTIIAHKAGGDRCPGSGQEPGEDVVLASWLPVSRGLTPHGLRHGHRTWMDEARIADVLKFERMGHEEPGMRGVYGHVSPAMRAELKAALQERWEQSLRERASLAPRSSVRLLDELLADLRPATTRIGSAKHRGNCEQPSKLPPQACGHRL
jgi:integrase